MKDTIVVQFSTDSVCWSSCGYQPSSEGGFILLYMYTVLKNRLDRFPDLFIYENHRYRC